MTDQATPLILASTSASRRALLEGAGLAFTCEAAGIDERSIESGLGSVSPGIVAIALSEAKALAVSRRHSAAIVIGADQTLGLGPRTFHKPESRLAARQQLLDLRGETHTLHSGVACAKDGVILFSHVSPAHMTMRHFSSDFLDNYLDQAGDSVLASVGCYQLEGPGVQLFETIDGDYFTVLGLPILPLLAFLRTIGAIHD